MFQMYAYSKKYGTSKIWLLYPVNAAMKDSGRITFDSGDDATVSLFFVDVANIEKSMEELLRILSPNITEENLTEEYIDGINAVG